MTAATLDKQEYVILSAVIGLYGLMQFCFCDIVASQDIVSDTPRIIIDCCKLDT